MPTVWLGLLEEIRKQDRTPSQFQNVVIGGSAAPKSMIEEFEELGITVCHAWGMTEMSPIGTQGFLPQSMNKLLSPGEQISKKCYQGRRVFGVDLKIIDEKGNSLPHDGKLRANYMFGEMQLFLAIITMNKPRKKLLMKKVGLEQVISHL